ncbi:hypothetical protein [Sangeribacter muris]|jgi:hypothetical protein|uniref:hypothetical protein n=1 Tax=Sangeribacter muris TaxID=2880703 RepID=UPI0013E8CD58|nr:hypothetical protein [Sangeribacter muris]
MRETVFLADFMPGKDNLFFSVDIGDKTSLGKRILPDSGISLLLQYDESMPLVL